MRALSIDVVAIVNPKLEFTSVFSGCPGVCVPTYSLRMVTAVDVKQLLCHNDPPMEISLNAGEKTPFCLRDNVRAPAVAQVSRSVTTSPLSPGRC